MSTQKKEISVLCVDVLPVARSWCMLTLDETYLFLSSEISDHLLYCVNYGSLSEVEGENKPREKEDEPDKEDETINETEEDETVNETEDDSGVDKHVENEPKEDKSGEDKSGEDKSEEDESKEEESEEEESEEDKPEEEDEADEDETEDDESEADKSEEDKSKVDKSEEDKSKVDKPEEDETGDEPKVDEPEENEPEENETEDKPEENETEDKPEENEPEENEPEENKHEENEHEENKHEENEHEEDKPEEDEPKVDEPKVDETEGDKPEGDESEEDESKESKPEEDESEKGKSKEDESEAGKSEAGKSEEDQSEEDQSEEDQSEEDQSEKDQSEKDQSEKDQSEKDQSEEDQSEEDQSEEDKPEENKPEEDNPEENKPKEKQIFELVLMLPNFSPLFDFQVGDLVDKGFSQMYIVGGRSLHSQLRVLELGCKITRNEELHWRIVLMSDDEELNNRTAWICKWETGENLLAEEEVLLFVPGIKMTSIFILNCSKELKKDSSAEISSLEQRIPQYPFITDENTLCCVQLGKDILQIIPKKVILVRGKKIIWSQELTVSIEVCAVNKFNVALYSHDGYLQYILFDCEEIKNGSLFKYKLSGYKCMFDDDFHYLDSTPIKMLRTVLHNQEAVIAMSKKKQFITCYYRGFFHLFPLISEFTYDYYVLFPEKEHCLLGYRNHRFDFISLPESGYLFAQSKFKLENTPCKIILDECWKKIIVLEREKVFSKKINDKKKGDLTLISEDGEDEPIEEMKSGWISLIEIIDPFDFKKKYSVPLEGNAYAMSVCTINSSPEGGFLIVGALLEFEELNRRGIPMALTYEISYGFTDAFERYSMKSSLNWLDKTVLDGQPTTICEYNGVILIAEGIYIGLYCLNNKRLELLSKKELVDKITSISTSLEYNLIIVGHVKYNVSIFRLSDCGEELDLVAEEHSVIPTTSVACLNENTFASVDNFGNFMMMTLESQQSKDLSEQLELEIQTKYNVGKIVKIHLEQLHEMARPCLLYMTYSGSIGVLLENTKSSEAFLLDLQKHMIANTVLCVGEHICDDEEEQSLIDGDLCLEYLTAPKDFRDAITSEMKRLPTFICDFLQHMKMIHYIWMD
ncbi:splicing factor 3B subunit 3 isoform X5 [Parasteatoda tepidariorum]|uniref:splicing factor 3B subunit 3 isoform X5 n=1 Tax=Parasteatoda tepidariorum TaxID=114398 RepID=UPI0039BC98EB